MPGLVSDVTRIWELNIHWPVNAQCAVWDPKLKGVDIWECIRAHNSVPGTQPVLALCRPEMMPYMYRLSRLRHRTGCGVCASPRLAHVDLPMVPISHSTFACSFAASEVMALCAAHPTDPPRGTLFARSPGIPVSAIP
ncbi:hypothetical protein NM688_g4037 [Phlebia brevispora]|uniref:Uncharacterized protein n=1 Tax=Phlebia brevispora TaxID=194682 RepID=A0ACC1T414_9APHY|nr:hypothetical protein NM688_g4037 [Phlebia brevispora]